MAEAAAPERQLKRALSAFDLTCIGIGAIIGTGIFALAGTAAAGEQAHAVGSIWKTPVLNFVQSWTTHASLVFGRPGAGPAVMLSFVVAGIACGFAALCYAELAAMIPVSGSAYTYSYATLGEIIAWIIGWDLILEYAVGNMAVAVGWSGYFVRLCGSLLRSHNSDGHYHAERRCARKLFVDYAPNHCRPRDRTESSSASHCRGSDGASGLRNS
ncbi:MAG: hypothetical protein DMF09_03850 [Verrucomicrobia bacterium]|nr:MAG: hypothetical protein DMF09_03850 [Verrucomicrobiota bacterium]